MRLPLLVLFLAFAPVAASAAMLDEPVDLREAPEEAPNIELRDAEDQLLRLSTLRGRPVLLVFWATWCAPCVTEMPGLNRLQEDYRPTGLRVAPVSIQSGQYTLIENFYQAHELDKLPIYLTESYADQKAFKVRAVPASFLIDAEGRRLWRFTGGVDWDSKTARGILDKYLKKR